MQLGYHAFPWAPTRFPGFRFWYLLCWGYKRAEQRPLGWRSNVQGIDWVRVLTKAKGSLSLKTKTAIFKCPACECLRFHVLKTEKLMKLYHGRTKSCRRFWSLWLKKRLKERAGRTERHAMSVCETFLVSQPVAAAVQRNSVRRNKKNCWVTNKAPRTTTVGVEQIEKMLVVCSA